MHNSVIQISKSALKNNIDFIESFIDKFNIPYKIIDVSKIYDSFIYLLNDKKKEGSAGVAVAFNGKYYLYIVTRKK